MEEVEREAEAREATVWMAELVAERVDADETVDGEETAEKMEAMARRVVWEDSEEVGSSR